MSSADFVRKKGLVSEHFSVAGKVICIPQSIILFLPASSILLQSPVFYFWHRHIFSGEWSSKRFIEYHSTSDSVLSHVSLSSSFPVSLSSSFPYHYLPRQYAIWLVLAILTPLVYYAAAMRLILSRMVSTRRRKKVLPLQIYIRSVIDVLITLQFYFCLTHHNTWVILGIRWTRVVNQLNQHLNFPSEVKLNPFH